MPGRSPLFALPLAGLFLLAAGIALWWWAPDLDRTILDIFRLERDTHWVAPVRLFSFLGALPFLAALGLLVAAGLFARGKRSRALWLILTIGTGRIAVELSKWLLERERPPLIDQLASVSSHSFPSAHAAGTMTVWIAIALVFPNQRLLPPLALAMATSIGWSRMALGVHWPSDVLGGFGLALLWIALARRWLPSAGAGVSPA